MGLFRKEKPEDVRKMREEAERRSAAAQPKNATPQPRGTTPRTISPQSIKMPASTTQVEQTKQEVQATPFVKTGGSDFDRVVKVLLNSGDKKRQALGYLLVDAYNAGKEATERSLDSIDVQRIFMDAAGLKAGSDKALDSYVLKDAGKNPKDGYDRLRVVAQDLYDIDKFSRDVIAKVAQDMKLGIAQTVINAVAIIKQEDVKDELKAMLGVSSDKGTSAPAKVETKLQSVSDEELYEEIQRRIDKSSEGYNPTPVNNAIVDLGKKSINLLMSLTAPEESDEEYEDDQDELEEDDEFDNYNEDPLKGTWKSHLKLWEEAIKHLPNDEYTIEVVGDAVKDAIKFVRETKPLIKSDISDEKI
ncbi:MAG: hypothetical protein IKQ31_02420 [Clostridia bacterium]|nr:hypothetical protein [Clostridia bacterium]